MSDFIDKYKSYISGLNGQEFIEELNVLLEFNDHITDETYALLEDVLSTCYFKEEKE